MRFRSLSRDEQRWLQPQFYFGPPVREVYIRLIFTRGGIGMVGKLVFNQDLKGKSGEVS